MPKAKFEAKIDAPDGCWIWIEASTKLAAPIRDVFEFVANPQNDVHWLSGLKSVDKLTDGPLKTGSRFRHTGKFLGRTVFGDTIVISFQPDSFIEVKSTGGQFRFFRGFRFWETVGETYILGFANIDVKKGVPPLPVAVIRMMLQTAANVSIERLNAALNRSRSEM